MRYCSLSGLFVVLFVNTILFDVSVQYGVKVWNSFRFPEGGNSMGIFAAVAVPLELKGPADVFFTAAIEAVYAMPSNQSYFIYPPIINSTSAREFVYGLIERKIDSYGYPGKQCLLRAICEASEHTIHASGVIGDIIHIFFTPSTSLKETSLEEYAKSELYGRKNGHCAKYKKTCKLSILSFVSKVTNKLQIYTSFLFVFLLKILFTPLLVNCLPYIPLFTWQ